MTSSLAPNHALKAGEAIVSPNGKFKLFVSSGDPHPFVALYRYAPRRIIRLWWTPLGTHSVVPASVDIHEFGFFRGLRGPNVKWTFPINGTRAIDGSKLHMQDDGNLTLRKGSSVTFHTRTDRIYRDSINPSIKTHEILTGTLAIDGETQLINEIPFPHNITDGLIAKQLAPGDRIQLNVPGGPETLAIETRQYMYNETESKFSGDATGIERPKFTVRGNTVTMSLTDGDEQCPMSHNARWFHTNFDHLLSGKEIKLIDSPDYHYEPDMNSKQ